MTLPIFKRQGNHIVARDPDTDKVVRDRHGEPVHALAPPRARPETLRRAIHRLTDGGQLLLETHLNIALGRPFTVKMPDGSMSTPEIPTAETRRAANLDILQFGFGKAVAQTEVVKAEQEAEDVEQYRAMSNEALRDAARPFLERADKPALEEGEE
jgi:hypothetical protein